MAELSNVMGLGQDGYAQYQAETTYGTAASGSEIDLPVKDDTEFTAFPERIENANIINDRTQQDPQQGRIVAEGSIVMDAWPTRLGKLLVQLLGDANGASAVGDGAYINNWLIPSSGLRVGKSFTWYQAVGVALADRLEGCVVDSFTISQDNQGNAEVTLQYRAQGYTENIARETTFSFPASATNPPFNFGHAKITATIGSDTLKLCADSFSVTVNLNHNLERYKICSAASGAKIDQPTFESIPMVEVSMSVDADQYITEYARAHTSIDLEIDWTHSTSQAGSTPTYHQLTFELPSCRLDPATAAPNTNDFLNQDLTFTCSYGGTTTNSAGATVQGEIRLTDDTDHS